jgi:TRAP-type C4-dicarboxylate transport system permease small subunit
MDSRAGGGLSGYTDVVLVALPARIARAMKLLGTALVAVFLGFVIWQGVVFIRATGIQMTPVLQIPFRHLYVVIPVSGALMLLYLILGAVDEFRRGGR